MGTRKRAIKPNQYYSRSAPSEEVNEVGLRVNSAILEYLKDQGEDGRKDLEDFYHAQKVSRSNRYAQWFALQASKDEDRKTGRTRKEILGPSYRRWRESAMKEQKAIAEENAAIPGYAELEQELQQQSAEKEQKLQAEKAETTAFESDVKAARDALFEQKTANLQSKKKKLRMKKLAEIRKLVDELPSDQLFAQLDPSSSSKKSTAPIQNKTKPGSIADAWKQSNNPKYQPKSSASTTSSTALASSALPASSSQTAASLTQYSSPYSTRRTQRQASPESATETAAATATEQESGRRKRKRDELALDLAEKNYEAEYYDLDPSVTQGASTALLKLHQANRSNDLLVDDEFVYVVVALKTPPEKASFKPKILPLVHTLWDKEQLELCMITPSERISAQIPKLGVPEIKKAVSVGKLERKYDRHEDKRKLSGSYHAFLASSNIIAKLPHLLGRSFYQQKKLPVSVRLPQPCIQKNDKKSGGVASTVQQLKHGTTVFFPSAANITFRVARTSFSPEQIAQNLLDIIPRLVELIPGNWANIQAIKIKTTDSLALPIFNKAPYEFKPTIAHPDEVAPEVMNLDQDDTAAPLTSLTWNYGNDDEDAKNDTNDAKNEQVNNNAKNSKKNNNPSPAKNNNSKKSVSNNAAKNSGKKKSNATPSPQAKKRKTQ